LELNLGKIINNYKLLVLVGGVIILLDQITKALVRNSLSLSEVWTPAPWMEPYFRIVHWRNTGAAFGLGQDFGMVFTILAIIVSGVIVYYFPRVPQEERSLRLAMGLQFGGAVGNLIDRLLLGYVVDFISIFAFLNTPVFNIADLSITVGVVVLVLSVWHKERKHESQEKAASHQEKEPSQEEELDDGEPVKTSIQEERWSD
jgi:signal peptidase II